MTYPLISVLVVFYNDKNTLARCLNSIVNQNYSNFEIVIVNDGSTDRIENKKYKSFIKQIQKENKKNKSLKKITYYVHKKNLGIVEARRTCVKLCRGKFCTFVDSDDYLENDTLQKFYMALEESNADIVHGCANVFFGSDIEQEKILQVKKRCNLVHLGVLQDENILDNFLCKHEHCNFMWGKLFRTQVVRFAFCNIPSVKIILAEDLLIYFFICMNASCYYGIDENIYNYNVSYGITSNTKITQLNRWKQVISASNVFKILYAYIEQDKLEENKIIEIKELCIIYLKNNLRQLKQCVDVSIQENARQLLYDYWGESFVKKVEEMNLE